MLLLRDLMQTRTGCDMRGMLSFQILWLLSKEKMNGEKIAEEIERRRGDKPKPGTIYPALKELKVSGLVTGKKDGREVVYSITGKGKAAVREATAYLCRSFGEIFTEGMK